MDLGLEDKHILITGGNGGIGIQTIRQFLDEGATVTATYHNKRENLDALDIERGHLNTIRADVREEEDVRNLFKEAVEKSGRVDVLVANAGVANHQGVGVQDMSLEQWENTLAVNLTGVFLCAKYFFKNLEQNPGESASLILVGSTAGLFGEAWYVDYATSKAALHGIMMSLKNEIVHLAKKGRINLVNPGWTVTPMAEGALEDRDMLRRIMQTIPMRKVAVPEDIAGAIIYLASDVLSGHMSGQTLTVAGGMEGRVLFSPDEIDL